MTSQRDVIAHIREEDADTYSDDDLFNISSWGADLSFRELLDRYEEGSLIKPELQRHYVWDKTEASRFIESLLLGLPVPSIFLAKTANEEMLIVDGYQRIMTVHDFVKGTFATDGKLFRLSRASKKVNKRWRGKAFTELADAEQRKIRNTTIHAIIFVQQHPSGTNTSLYQIFERINTSGRSLLPQEIRNCVYQGTFNTLLLALNNHAAWRSMYGLPVPDNRMRDMEYILRFFALSSPELTAVEKEGISLKKFLNTYMGTHKAMSENEAKALGARFSQTVELIHKELGPSAFQNISPTSPDRLTPKFGPTIFDSITIETDRAISNGKTAMLSDPEGRRRVLLQDPKYRKAITQETMRLATIELRVAMAYDALFGAG
jgi:hypothetical protein